ncbi:hypothetical protein [Streptomyces sp. NRRL F-5650]|uniref:hypothetical protein n=1 Tax=Streptomyces sp. NRRL F-5650 TaxID=1463868 RepID=UPI00131DE74B|nr:hypothetical protein [Streptomyces sp. NRRL F-5650]
MASRREEPAVAVRMRHDGIEQGIEVQEISVKHYKRAGWVVVDDDGWPVAEQMAAAKGRRRRETGES